jgi:hypothetical protein
VINTEIRRECANDRAGDAVDVAGATIKGRKGVDLLRWDGMDQLQAP